MSSGFEPVDEIENELAQSSPSRDFIPYAIARRRDSVLLALFGLGIVLSTSMIASNVSEFRLLDRIVRQQPVTDEEIETNDMRQGALGAIWLLWYLVTIVAFLMWVHRAHRNLPALGATDLEFTPGWAVGWYFVPFANLFRPYQAMRELYNAGDPKLPTVNGVAWGHRNGAFVVKLWWAWFVIMGFFGNIVARASFRADTPAALQLVAAGSVVDDVFTIIASLAAIWMIWRVNQRQEERAAMLGLESGPQFAIA